MTQKNEHPSTDPVIGQDEQIYPRRRRLLTGTTAGAGVFLAMHARTALGTTACKSPSAMISGNTSPRPGDGHICSGGRSPGFWKQPQHFSYWGPSGLIPPTFSVQVQSCMQGLGDISPCNISNIGTTISTIFPGATGGSKGIWEVLVWPTNYPKVNRTSTTCTVLGPGNEFGQQGQLLRHLACAYLNAAYFGSAAQDYPLTMQQVKDMWLAVKGGGLYCPTGMTCDAGTGMSATQIVSYIQGLYGINAEVEGDVCKKP
jgi:hypothetical protein